jgi:hypothetical protein
MSIKNFAIILFSHRLWGYILAPYILVREDGEKYFKLSENLSPFPNTETMGSLTAEERELVKIINEYNDRNLFKLFSRDKSVKDFLEKVTEENIEKFIRPFIERRLYKCLTLAREESIPLYFRKNKVITIHPEDELLLNEENAEPLFRFEKGETESYYSLNLEYSGKKVNLNNGTMEILCNSPCIIRDESQIFFVSDTDGSKLKPFLTKDKVIIPKKSEVKYFSGFVLNTVNNNKVESSGFSVINHVPHKEAQLTLETGLNGSTGLTLQFQYEKTRIYHSDTMLSFTDFQNNGENILFKKYFRDFDWEEERIESLSSLGFFSEDDIHFYPDNGQNKTKHGVYTTIELVNSNYDEITASGFVLNSRLDLEYNLRPVEISINSTIENDWFDLKASVKIGEWIIPFSHFRKNIIDGIREFRLPDGSVAVLPETWFTKYKSIFELGKTENDSLRIHKQHFSLLNEALVDQGRKSFERLEKLLVPDQIPLISAPEGLNCDMRKYQSDGLNWLNFLQTSRLGGCLADDMGLGKTIQTLAMLQYNKENLKPAADFRSNPEPGLFDNQTTRLTSLIIVPASLIYNWEQEIRRFVPDMTVYSYKGNLRKKSTSYFNEFDIILSSYHTVRQDIDLISQYTFHYIILDESQLIKNPASMLYRTVTRLRSEYKLVLTGTPVENSLTDMWTQLNFVNPGLLGDLAYFRKEFAKPIEKLGDDEKENQLRKIIKPFILRRTKEKVAVDLPPVTEQTVFCDMTDEQYKIYDEEKSSVRNSILKSISSPGHEKSSIVVLQGLMKLRQLSNHPVLAYEDYTFGSGKFETVIRDMENVIAEGHKILVFSSFVKHLNLFADILRKQRRRFAILTGASTRREKIVNSFQNDPDTRIFLISLKAGGVGLNLTAADYVFILDPWWNPASEMQAMNRAHRIGQDKNVFVYRYITSNSIEEKIVRLQDKKSRLADIFISSNNPLKDINIEEILEIIG